MPWTCCDPDEHLPDNLACPQCAKTKASHTLRFQSTKVFKIGAKARPVVKLLWVRGDDTRPDGDVKAVIEDGDGQELFNAKVPLSNGEIVVKVKKGKTAAKAKLIVLDENLDETQEGLLLTLPEEPLDDTDAAVFSGRLRALGFLRAPALEPGADVDADADVALDVQQAFARFQRGHAEATPVLPYVKDQEQPLATLTEVWSDYVPRRAQLESPEFPEDHDTLATVLRVHFHRGGGSPEVLCRVIVEDAQGGLLLTSRPLNPSDGKLEVEVPADDAQRAAKAKVVFLDEDLRETGEGFLLTLGEALTIDGPAPASHALRALGYATGLPLDGPPSDPDATLALDLALARFLRERELRVEAHSDAQALGELDRTLRDYTPRTGALEAPEFDESHDTLATVVRLHVHRGSGARALLARVELEAEDGRLILSSRPLDAKDGKLELEVPADEASSVAKAKVRFLNDDLEETGEGLLLTVSEPAEIDGPVRASQVLRALGFAGELPLSAPPSDPDAILALDQALARQQRAHTPDSGVLPHSDSKALAALRAAYTGYAPARAAIQAPEV